MTGSEESDVLRVEYSDQDIIDKAKTILTKLKQNQELQKLADSNGLDIKNSVNLTDDNIKNLVISVIALMLAKNNDDKRYKQLVRMGVQKRSLKTEIINAYKKSLISGKGQGRFGTEDNISLQEALVILIRALGLETMAPTPYAITPFADDNKISTYARNSVYVASKIGLINADQRGYIYPESYITIGETSVLMNKFIKYLCEGLKNDWEKSIKNTYSF